jgi:hypothetical protein
VRQPTTNDAALIVSSWAAEQRDSDRGCTTFADYIGLLAEKRAEKRLKKGDAALFSLCPFLS